MLPRRFGRGGERNLSGGCSPAYRKVRRDVADLFSTNADGVRAEGANAWKLVDTIANPLRRTIDSRAITTRASTSSSTAPRATRR